MVWGVIAIMGVALMVVVWRRPRRTVDIDVGPVSSGWLADKRVDREGWQS